MRRAAPCVQELKLDFYGCIKLINFVRKQVCTLFYAFCDDLPQPQAPHPRPCTLQVAATRAANATALDDANARKQVRGRFARCASAAVVALAVSRAPAVRRSAARSDIGGAGAPPLHHLAVT